MFFCRIHFERDKIQCCVEESASFFVCLFVVLHRCLAMSYAIVVCTFLFLCFVWLLCASFWLFAMCYLFFLLCIRSCNLHTAYFVFCFAHYIFRLYVFCFVYIVYCMYILYCIVYILISCVLHCLFSFWALYFGQFVFLLQVFCSFFVLCSMLCFVFALCCATTTVCVWRSEEPISRWGFLLCVQQEIIPFVKI